MTININNAKFVPNSRALVDTLFRADGTASGTYRIRKGGILFLRPNGEPEAFLVANRWGECFFVSCGKTSSGKTYYLYSTDEETERFLGIEGMKYSERIKLAESIWEQAQSIKSAKTTA